MTYRKKLIEVALPLDAINAESARENYIYKGNPSAVHKWWAQRPLAACRAVIFASLVDDPSAHLERFPSKEAQKAERERLFDIIRDLVKWENNNNQTVLDKARAEIRRSTGSNPPPLLDPFCGGGSIPLEAQRLGLEVRASDLNPVAVLITKALIEIPPKFAGKPPINPESRKGLGAGHGWTGARGLAEDVLYYGRWMYDEAQRRIGHLYPKVTLPREQGGDAADVLAWLWARTVKCPNPACGTQLPLVRSFWLSTKPGKKAWVEPIVDRATKSVHFEVRTGQGEPREGTVNRQGATCVVCSTSVPFDHIRAEGKAGRMGAQMMAVVAEGRWGRIYLPPTQEQESIASQAQPEWVPDTDLPEQALGFRVQLYGMTRHSDLFTRRQLVALTTFSDLVAMARERARQDAVAAGLPDDGIGLAFGGIGAQAYADAVATYLAFSLDKTAEYGCTIVPWYAKEDRPKGLFARQAIPMVWDYAEVNPLVDIGGSFDASCKIVAGSLAGCYTAGLSGEIAQRDAMTTPTQDLAIISTDPPYYDNVGYADLSDFFYVWLRRCLGRVYPNLFSTMLVPKAQELIASPYRFDGSKDKAREFFEHGLAKAFAAMRAEANPDYPVTIFYAFKQAESDGDSDDSPNGRGGSGAVSSTGWETMLSGLIDAGFTITGTWPMRSERGGRMNDIGANALASSIVLVCRPRPVDAPRSSRRDFVTALRRELPQGLRELQHGNIAPVDLAQATIGPGMAVFSGYSRVMEADGSPMRVRTALQLINQTLDEVLAEQEGEFDSDTRWTLAWFEHFGTGEGQYGVAETLSKAKNTSVAGLAEAGLLVAKAGKVRLLRREEMRGDGGDGSADGGRRDAGAPRKVRESHGLGAAYGIGAPGESVWAVTQRLIAALERDGENGAAALLATLGERGEIARDLAYRLYTLCERKGWADEALAYNSLVIAWPRIMALASRQAAGTPRQQEMFT